MNPMQDLYLSQLGIRNESIEFGDMYCQWSATLTVQEMSQHFTEHADIKKCLGQGEPLAFKYMPRPKRKPSENIRSKHLGFLTEVYKMLTRLKIAIRREEAGVYTPQGLIKHVAALDQITAEMETLLPSAPKHKEISLEADKWARTLAALQRHR